MRCRHLMPHCRRKSARCCGSPMGAAAIAVPGPVAGAEPRTSPPDRVLAPARRTRGNTRIVCWSTPWSCSG